jgi:electron transfer flavoprotein alpha subunit
MAIQIYAYILHQDGAADDTAFELITAARKIDPDASVTALVIGAGEGLDTVCNEIASTYQEIWKIDNEALSYPNAEIIRGLLVRILPKDSIVLVPHEHFGMDLSPGLSVKLDAVYLPDAVDMEGIEDGTLKAVREEYSSMVSTHMNYDISGGAVINVRPGAFQADESKSTSGQVVDKTDEAMAGDLPGSGRRFLEVIEAEVGDVDITKS